MPKLRPDTQRARRDNILDAARGCFARGGFHATTMQQICKEAGVSPGALYTYFDSKEDLIEGLCEPDRAEFAEQFANLAEAPDCVEALAAIGQHYFVNMTPERQRFVIEMGIESTRNPRIAEIFLKVDRFCLENFAALFQRLKDKGRIAPDIEISVLAQVFSLVGDGMFWRRAVEPGFDASRVLPVCIEMVMNLLKPTETFPRSNSSVPKEAAQ